MRYWRYGLGFSVTVGLGWALVNGCAAGGNTNTGAATSGTGASGTGGSTGGSAGVGLVTSGTTTVSTGTMPFPVSSSNSSSGTGGAGGALGGLDACATFKAQAQQAPAAMLVVLQASASMGGTKWTAAHDAILSAINDSVFDTMSLGLTAFPVGTTPAPACLEGIYPNVYCSYPGYVPQGSTTPVALPVPIEPAAMARTDITAWLSSHLPETQDPSDSSPVYDAMNYGYQVLQATNIDKRMMILITDGGFDCTSVSNDPTRINAAYSDGLCNDWENPSQVNLMITNARTSATAPVDTFIVGVPGSNSNGAGGNTAPYDMLLALSTYAVSGSPTTVPAGCDSSAVFSQNGSLSGPPCHIDLSNSANFNAAALGNTIATLRGAELGCVYPVPQPMMGQMADPNKVNVVVTINGTPYVIPKRSSPTDTCLTNSNPCWDYTDTTDTSIELVGITCSTVSTSPSAEVEIYVGCDTIFT
jgi:hypothetical protein